MPGTEDVSTRLRQSCNRICRRIPPLGVVSSVPKHYFAGREHMSVNCLEWPSHNRGPLPNGAALGEHRRGGEELSDHEQEQHLQANSAPVARGGPIVWKMAKRGGVRPIRVSERN